MSVAVVGELVVAGGELLQALRGDGGEVAGELGVLGQHHRAPGHERVDQRLLPHRLGSALPLRSLRRRWIARRRRRRRTGQGAVGMKEWRRGKGK